MLLSKLLRPAAGLVTCCRYRVERLRLARLMERGMKVGRNVYISAGVEFDRAYPFLIEIGDNCRISRGVRVLSHDATTFRDLGVTRMASVKILEGTFIGERAIIMPGVTIGPRALIGAGSFVNRDVGEDMAVAGNPARPYGKFSDVLARVAETALSAPVFERRDIDDGTVVEADIVRALENSPAAFVHGVPGKDPYYINADYSRIRANAVQAFAKVITARGPCEATADTGNRSSTPKTDPTA